MYGLPRDFDPRTLIGEMLVQVCVGQSDLILQFEPQASILVTSAIGYALRGGQTIKLEGFPEAGRALIAILGDEITAASALNGRTLRLDFRKGASVEILDDSDQFESYTITRGDQLIVV